MQQKKLYKKAQSYLVLTFPILLILIVVIGIFFSLVFSLKSLSAHPTLEKESSATKNILLSSGKFSIENSKEEILIMEALILATQADLEYKRLDALINSGQYSSQAEQNSLIEQKNSRANALIKFKDELVELLKDKYKEETSHCVLIFQGPGNTVEENIKLEKGGKDIFIKIRGGEAEFSYNSILFEKYAKKDLVNLPQIKISFPDNTIKTAELKYYNGECKYE